MEVPEVFRVLQADRVHQSGPHICDGDRFGSPFLSGRLIFELPGRKLFVEVVLVVVKERVLH